jgi:TatD DNase family protein
MEMTMLRIIDTHAHLEEIENLEQALAEAKAADVIAIIAVGSDTKSNQQILDIARLHPGFVFPALGLHPSNLKPGDIEKDIEFINNHAFEAIAIGEIGLDYHKKVLALSAKNMQQLVFSELLRIAVSHNKVALVHSRYSWKDCYRLVEEAGLEKAVFHWYTGPSSVLRDILSHGYYISVTPAVEYHSDHRRAALETPLDRILLETDSPVTYRLGQSDEYQARPVDVNRSLKETAALKELSAPELAEITTSNAIKLFELSFKKPDNRWE